MMMTMMNDEGQITFIVAWVLKDM